jgi:hypothetical protein
MILQEMNIISHLPGVMLGKIVLTVAIASSQMDVVVVKERRPSHRWTKFLQPRVNYAQIGTATVPSSASMLLAVAGVAGRR